jgi:hypothetical protein
VLVHGLGRIAGEANAAAQARTWLDEWLLGRLLGGSLQTLGLDEGAARHAVTVIKLLTTHQRWFSGEGGEKARAYAVLEALLRDGDVQQFLGVNRYRDVLWFNKESYAQLLGWLFLVAVLELGTGTAAQGREAAERIMEAFAVVRELERAGEASEYQVEKLLAAAKG